MNSLRLLCRLGQAKAQFAMLVLGTVGLYSQNVSAAPATPERAIAVVRGWLKNDPKPLDEALPTAVSKVDTVKDTSGSNLCFVVYLKPSGFVVVAPDDGVEPVIAFSGGGQFSNDGPLGALLAKHMPNRVAHARKNELAAVGGEVITSKSKWRQFEQSSASGVAMNSTTFVPSDVRVAPFVQSRWDQSTVSGQAVYNYYTPPYNPGNLNNYVCGCVATAQAQVMRYFRFPNGRVGTAQCRYTIDNQLESATLRGGDGMGGPYDWANMPLVPSNPTPIQCQAIGALTYDAALSCEMDFSASGSGSSPFTSCYALLRIFHYSNAFCTMLDCIPNSGALMSMINPNLDARLPVVFGIGIGGGAVGHAVVCDGYGYSTSTIYHHINMGWGGSSDAWYALPNITDSFDTVGVCMYNIFTNGTGEIISGRIRDASGTPIYGVSVSADNTNSTVTTDAHGIYAITCLTPLQSHTITASKTGLMTVSQSFSTGIDGVTEQSGNCWGADFTMFGAQLSITQQPISQNAIPGSTATFFVGATANESLSYQWQFNETNIDGATASTYSIRNVSVTNAGGYRALVITPDLSATSSVAVLTVSTPPYFASPPANQAVGAGSNVTFRVSVLGDSPISYQWQLNGVNIPNAQNSAYTVVGAGPSQAGRYSVIASNKAGTTTSSDGILTILSAPSITQQPQNVTGVAGARTTLSVTAAGSAPLAYQWRRDGTIVPGATSADLTLTKVSPGDAGTYTVVITNAAGCVTSTLAMLSVISPPFIVKQPISQAVGAGTNVTFSVSVTVLGGSPISYQWQLNGVNIPNAQDSDYTVVGAGPSQAGRYSVIASNKAGTTTSTAGVLTILSGPSITTQPQSVTSVAGDKTVIKAAAAGSPPLSYQWLRDGAIVPGATFSDFTATNVSIADAGIYSLVVTNAAGCVTSTWAMLTVIAPPLIVAQPTNQTVWTGGKASFSVTATGTAPLCYQWQSNSVNIPDATSTNYTVTASNDCNYRVVITNVVGCVTSRSARLTIAMRPGITSQPQSQTNVAGATVTFSVSAVGTAPFYYQWLFDGQPVVGATRSTYSIPAVALTNAGTYCVTISNSFGVVTSSLATLTVLTPPTILIAPVSQSLGAGSNVTFNVQAASDLPMSYQWRFNGTNLNAANATNYAIAGVYSANAGDYTVVVMNDQGAVTSSVARLTIWLPPSILTQPANQTNALGTAATFTVLASGSSPLSYQWLHNQTAIESATSTNLPIASVSLSDLGKYTVVITNAAGSITSSIATLTLRNAPVITAHPLSQAVRVGSNLVLSVSAVGTPPLSYQWQKNGTRLVNSSHLSGATGATLTVSRAAATDSGNYTVVITNFLGAATSSNALVNVYTPDTTKPTLTVTAPSAGQRIVTNCNLLSISGTSRDNAAISNVFVQLNTNDWVRANSTNRWTNWTVNLSVVPGTNIVRARATDTAGNGSSTTTVSFAFAPLAKLVVVTNSSGCLTPCTNGQYLIVGSNYTVTAKAATGWVFSNWSGTVSGGGNPLTFRMQSNTVLQPVFIRNPFPSFAGVYQGLFISESNQVSLGNCGAFNATVDGSGSFSASFALTNRNWPFSGQFSVTGGATNLVTFGKQTVAATLQLDMAGSNFISGSVSNGAWTAQVLAYRTTYSSNNPAPQAGRYSLAIPGSEISARQPGGDSYGSLLVDDLGKTTFTGMLADGAEVALSQSSIVSKNGQIPLYISLYNGGGSILGWLTFTNDPSCDLCGWLTWIKPAGVKVGATAYRPGFTNVSEAVGSRYTNTTPTLKLANGTVQLTQGDLAQSLATQFILGKNNVVTSTNTTLSLNFVTPFGFFQGALANPYAPGKTISFKGVVLQKQTNGFGYFLGTNQTGEVIITR